ncbi:MAG: sulfatase-like hydrolase/transferase [Akkermansiaceae bacterium]|nr:sulfatase-like hydrolase/transferase [Akkermansiaceae bacterium]
MKRTHILSLVLAVLAPLSLAGEKPNILLIVADDMGYGDLSCYGSKQIKTPNLDKLAENGIRCTDGYVTNCVCAPSRAGLLTGRYGSRFGFEHNLGQPDYLKPEFAGIPLDEPLVSDRMKALGYRTGMIGKWHLGESVEGHHPNARGFEFFFGMLGGHHDYWPTPDKNQLLFNRDKVTEIRTPYLTDWFTLEAIDFINNRGKAATRKTDAPWFLYLSYNTPHAPMQAKKEDLEKYAHIHNKTRRIYCAMQDCMDRNIGKVIDTLKTNKQLENTLIVFISDNGGSVEVSHAVNAPLTGTKGTYYEGGIRVPTIFHWPAKLKPGVYQQPLISLDFMATFVAAAGGTPPAPGKRIPRSPQKGRANKATTIYDSVDLTPFLTGEKTDAPHAFLAWRTALRQSAIRMGDWKLLQAACMPTALYNLAEDIGETKNVAAEHPDIVRRLLDKQMQWEASFERVPMFMSAPMWGAYNAGLYKKTYSLTQPEPDSKENIWSLKR